ncbi:MAG: DUF2807 domain-containing protein [Candidatus Eremiobacteraeota bacterium]|nr:DUF2807 domain-containing protein [Candidatus Eremiobacteraeota bacterium]
MENYDNRPDNSEYDKNKRAIDADMEHANEHQKRSKGIKTCLTIFIVLIILAVLAALAALGMYLFVSKNVKKVNFQGMGIKGSGNMAEEIREVPDFTKIEVKGGLDVEVKCGEKTKIIIEADDNLISHIQTNVEGDKLTVKSSGSFSGTKGIKIIISARNIDELKATGASKIKMEGLRNESLNVDANGASKVKLEGETEDLKIKASGASKIKLDDIKTEKIYVEITGASSLNATGASEDLNIKGAGASSIDMEELKAQNVMLDISGASNATINVEGTLRVKATGASSIKYSGSPQDVQSNLSGASKLEKY